MGCMVLVRWFMQYCCLLVGVSLWGYIGTYESPHAIKHGPRPWLPTLTFVDAWPYGLFFSFFVPNFCLASVC